MRTRVERQAKRAEVRAAVAWWRQQNPGLKVRVVTDPFAGWVLRTVEGEARNVASMETVLIDYAIAHPARPTNFDFVREGMARRWDAINLCYRSAEKGGSN